MLNHWYRMSYTRRLPHKTKQTIGRNHWENRAKALRKSSHTDRSPCSQRSIRDDFQMGFTRFSQCFRLIYPLLSHHTSIAFVSYKGENHLIVWYKTGSSRIWSDELYISIIRALTKTNKTPYFGQNLRFSIKGMADGLTRASSRPSFVIPFIGAASCTVPTIGR